jgi:hypothetical protein
MIYHDTPGLNAAQALERYLSVRRWLIRVYTLIQISGCDLRTAIAAVELADHTQDAD